MDPLSITASAVGLIGFATECAQGLAKLRALQQAPTELSALINEISDLNTILTQVIALSHQLQSLQGTTADGSVVALKSLLNRAQDQLLELHNLTQNELKKPGLKPSGSLRVNKIGWLFSKEKVTLTQQNLRTTRLNIATSLGVVNSSALTRVELAVQSISMSQGRDSSVLKQISDCLTSAGLSPNQSQSIHNQGLPLFPNSSVARLWDNRIISNQSWTAQPDGGKLAGSNINFCINVRARAQTFKVKCKPWCSCACHKQRTIRYPEWLRSTIGGLFVGYTGLPVFTRACTESTCCQRSAPSVEVTYHFPNWFLSRVFSLNLRLSSLAGPELSIRMPRMVNWTTPLWQKAAVGDIAAIQSLFGAGVASPYDVNAYGQSALHYAADIFSAELCHFLIQNNADVYLRDENGRRPIDYAWDVILANKATPEVTLRMTELFSEGEYLETRQFTILHKTVLGLIPSSLKIQLDLSGANVNMVDANGRTCLSWAAARTDRLAMEILLEHGADPRLTDMEGNPPHFHAIRAGAIDCVSLLISCGADLQVKDVFGANALHVACTGTDDPDMVEFLVKEAHIDINAMDYDGDTALNYAARAGLDESAQLLLDAGADPTIANVAGDTAMFMAVNWRASGVLSQLANCDFNWTTINARRQTLLHSLASHFDRGMLDVLARARALKQIDTSLVDIDGLTCFDLLRREGEGDTDIEERQNIFQAFLDGLDRGDDASDDDTFVDAIESLVI